MNNAEKFVACLIGPMQDIEDAFQQLLTERFVDNAIGVQLTAIGKLVGRAREGITDDDVFRRHVRAQIATNNSDGLVEDILTIADLIVYDDDATYTIDQSGPAAFAFTITGIAPDAATLTMLIAFLRRAVAAGVRIIVETWPTDDEDDFFAFESYSEYATAVFPGFVVRATTPGLAGEGITVTIYDAPGADPVLTLDTPTAVTCRFDATGGDMHIDSTWAQLYAALNLSAYIQVESSTAVGTMLSSDAGSAVTDNSVDQDAPGQGFADGVIFNLVATAAEVEASNSGGGDTTVTVPAADYTDGGDVTALLEALEDQLNDDRPPTYGSWWARLNAGLVTIDGSGFTLVKTGGVPWTAGAASVETFAGDGYVETTIAETNVNRMFGLGIGDVNQSYGDVDYGAFLGNDTHLYIQENGSTVFDCGNGTLVTGDVIRVRRTGTIVTYERNGAVVYTSLVPTSVPLRFDTTFEIDGATLRGARLVDDGVPVMMTWQNVVDVAITLQSYSLDWSDRSLRNTLGFDRNLDYPATPEETEDALGFGDFTNGVALACDEASGDLATLYGSPATFTAFGLTYGTAGPRGGRDKTVTFDTLGDAADGGDILDMDTGDDLLFVLGVTFTTVAGSCDILGKNWGGAGGKYILAREGADIAFYMNDGVDAVRVAVAITQLAQHRIIVAVDRATNRARVGAITLGSGVTVLSTSDDVSVIGSLTNADTFRFGNSGAYGAGTVVLDSFYGVTGAGVAAGVPANLLAALTNWRATFGPRTADADAWVASGGMLISAT